MSIDLSLLRLLKKRAQFEQLARGIPDRAVSPQTKALLGDFARFYRDFPDSASIDPDAFRLLFKRAHPSLTPEDLRVYGAQLTKVFAEDVDPAIAPSLMFKLQEAAMAVDVAVSIEAYERGDDVDVRQHLQGLIDKFDSTVQRKVKNPQVLDPIEDLLQAEQQNEGFSFRLNCLNRHIKPLVPGDFVLLAARPDKGKTSFWADQLTFMAPQVDKFFPGENRSILWFNNEGPGRRIVTRTFQAALGVTMEELIALSNTPSVDPKWKTKVREDYVAAVGGRPGVLRIMDIHDMWNYEVEEYIKKYPPAIILWDMVDNVKFGGEILNGGQRTDQILEGMYQWARLMAVKYECVCIANSQLSADADGLQYPTLPQLKDSKTGKQGAADVILTMGAVNDMSLADTRFFGTTKNKKTRTGERASPQQDVLFDRNRCRFVELTQ